MDMTEKIIYSIAGFKYFLNFTKISNSQGMHFISTNIFIVQHDIKNHQISTDGSGFPQLYIIEDKPKSRKN